MFTYSFKVACGFFAGSISHETKIALTDFFYDSHTYIFLASMISYINGSYFSIAH